MCSYTTHLICKYLYTFIYRYPTGNFAYFEIPWNLFLTYYIQVQQFQFI
jgi:hypothetical protein